MRRQRACIVLLTQGRAQTHNDAQHCTGSADAGQRLTLRVAPQSSVGGAGAVTYSLTQSYVHVEGVQEA